MVCESEGELGSGEMRGAMLAGDEELTGELPLPRKRPLIPENKFDILLKLSKSGNFLNLKLSEKDLVGQIPDD